MHLTQIIFAVSYKIRKFTFRNFLNSCSTRFPSFFWHKQPGLKNQTPKNLKELVAVGQKMKKPTNSGNGVFSQSGASTIAARPIKNE